MAELHEWLNAQLAKISRNHDVAKAINYMLRRWSAFTRFLDDGRVCLSSKAAERSLRCVPLGCKSWLFCGSDRGGQRAAIAYSLIQTARLNDVDPQAWLADVLARVADHSVSRLDELLPWNWQTARLGLAARWPTSTRSILCEPSDWSPRNSIRPKMRLLFSLSAWIWKMG